jgi:hypothetical protein
VTVKVTALIEAVFIAMLKVALMGVLTPTFVAPLAGIVDTTDGTVTVSWPHPATKTTNRAASQYVIPNLYLRICTFRPTSWGPVFNNCHSPEKARTRNVHVALTLVSYSETWLSRIAHKLLRNR